MSSILFNEEHKEVISGHGFSLNQLSVWKFANMTKVTDLTGIICHIGDVNISRYAMNILLGLHLIQFFHISSYGPLFMKIHRFKGCQLSKSNSFDQNFMKLCHIV